MDHSGELLNTPAAEPDAHAAGRRDRLLAEVAALPGLPGVYRYFDAAGQVLYVGKARNLKKRVSSYFHKDHGGTRIGAMVARIERMETTVVRSESEALLLESNLIKSLQPRFNILFRDDKSYPYLKVVTHTYPRLAYFRGAVDRRHRYFGPYPNAWAVKDSIQLLQKVFRLRTCEDTVFNNRTRPCLLHQIQRCSAPCVKAISPQAYAADVANAQRFLEGQTQEVLEALQAQMMRHADELAFEKAAQDRDRITALSKVLHQQSVDTAKTAMPTSWPRWCRGVGPASTWPWCAAGDTWATGPISDAHRRRGGADRCVCRGPGRPSTSGTKLPDRPVPETQVLEAFIAQHYMGAEIPPVLVLSHAVDRELIAALGQQSQRRIQVVLQPREQRRAWLDMAVRGGELALGRLLAEEGSQQARTRALVEALDLAPESLDSFRIECFDVSHTPARQRRPPAWCSTSTACRTRSTGATTSPA